MRLLARSLLCLVAAASAWASEPANPEQVAKEVRAREEELARLREKATSVLDELQGVEDEVAALQEAAEKAELDARIVSARVAAAQKDEDASRQALVDLLDQLAPRLRARYRLSREQRANILLSASSVGDLIWLKRSLDQVLAGDMELVGKAREAVTQLRSRRARLETVKLEYAQRAQLAADKRARATKRKDELASLHEGLMEQQDLKEKTLKELYRVQADLSRYVRDLPAAESKKVKASFTRKKGKMPFPVKGLIEVGFGKVLNPKFNTVTFQKGIDIRASEGADVSVVGPGKVVHAGPFRGYGNLVIVDHGEGYHSLYAHLGTLKKAVGDDVDSGEVLGTVGDTGSLKGPYLYFEIREAGKPVDPREWLSAP
jgi:septal ring factor EnvC (AmiA/AmiB activator)